MRVSIVRPKNVKQSHSMHSLRASEFPSKCFSDSKTEELWRLIQFCRMMQVSRHPRNLESGFGSARDIIALLFLYVYKDIRW